MTQNEIIWALFTVLQGGVFMFVTYWTRRIQNLEKVITESIQERTRILVEYQGRVSRLEVQWDESMRILKEIRDAVIKEE